MSLFGHSPRQAITIKPYEILFFRCVYHHENCQYYLIILLPFLYVITSVGFGSGGSLFGAKTTATTGFGTVAPSQTGSSIFGNNTTGSTGLFGAGTNQAKSKWLKH